MMRFAADHSAEIAVDGENYYDRINSLLLNKESQDVISAELNFAMSVLEVLDSDKTMYDAYNALYSYVSPIESVDNIQDTLHEYKEIISLLFPVIIGSPTIVSKMIQCERALFDNVIIDEASQLPLEKALPIIYRGNTMCIVGDKKQLQPISFLNNLQNAAKLQKALLTNTANVNTLETQLELLDGASSTLEYIEKKIQSAVLNYHYRSEKTELIHFSNCVFYKKEMNVADDQSSDTSGLKLVDCHGTMTNKVNQAEAKAVLRVIEEICAKPNHGSIGIITTTTEQKEYLENLILHHPSKAVSMELNRSTDDGEDISLFLKETNNVQGDERDIILLSLVFSGKTTMVDSFGLLNSEIGKNYLNVMISRAKKDLYVFKSFAAEEIPSRISESIDIFKDFIHYCEFVEKFNHDLSHPDIEALFKPYLKDDMMMDFANDLKNKGSDWLVDSLCEQLKEKIDVNKVELVKNHFEGKVKIGVAVKCKATNKFILGIMCDDFNYDITVSSKQRDFYDRKYLEIRNWNFVSMTALQWCKTYKQQPIVDLIVKKIDEYLPSTSENRTAIKAKKSKVASAKKSTIKKTKVVKAKTTNAKKPSHKKSKSKKSDANYSKTTIIKDKKNKKTIKIVEKSKTKPKKNKSKK